VPASVLLYGYSCRIVCAVMVRMCALGVAGSARKNQSVIVVEHMHMTINNISCLIDVC